MALCTSVSKWALRGPSLPSANWRTGIKDITEVLHSDRGSSKTWGPQGLPFLPLIGIV